MEWMIALIGGVVVTTIVMSLATRNRLNKAREEALRLGTEKDFLQKSCDEKGREMTALNGKMERLQEENRTLTAEREGLIRENKLRTEQHETEKVERERQFEEQLKLVKEQITTTTQQMLNSRSEELSKSNQTQMDAIIKPLKETIAEMEKSMKDNKETSLSTTASLKGAIDEMMKRAEMIGTNADHLAEALRNENKIQGNWGEVILDELLTSQGLREGVHYDKQTAMVDENGKVMKSEEGEKTLIPDVILHYPDGKDAIIDSKVSLVAFLDYQEAETEEERAKALKRHLESVKHQAKLLSTKNYNKYLKPSRQAIDYVIMFIPNESAYQLAMANDPKMWRDAFEEGVFITGEMTLIAALRMISVTWTQVEQVKNQEEIMSQAQTILDRTSDFMTKFEEVGMQLERATNKFGDAQKKLYGGNQSLLKAARKMVDLGIPESAKKRLPRYEDGLLSGGDEIVDD